MKCYYYILLVSIWFIIFSLLSIQHLNKEHVEDVVYFTSKPCPNSNMIVKKNDIAPQPISSKTEEVAVNNLPTYLPSPTEPELKKPTVNPENNSNNGTEPIVYDSSYKWKWEGDVDYDAIAAAVLKRFRGEDEDSQPYYIVYNVDYTVGFANQFRSLSGIFLIALASGRRLRINWGDYYTVMDSYFSEIRYSPEEVKNLQIKSYIRFPRGVCNMTQYQSHDIDQIFGKRHLSFTILTDLSCFVLPNPKYQEVLRRLGFDIRESDQYNPINEEGYRSIRRQIARLLLTPNFEISYHIRENLKKFKQRPIVGIQVRTGGYVSTTVETHRFLHISSLRNVDKEINLAAEKYNWNNNSLTLFITTDSAIVNRRMYTVYGENRIIEGEGYPSGHSSAYLAPGPKHYRFLKRAIMDLVLLSQCDYILYTHGSSYGKLAMRLSYNVPSRAICRDDLCTPFS